MEKTAIQKNNKQKDYIFAVGRRKSAVARVRLYDKPTLLMDEKEYKRGDILVNNKLIDDYFRFFAYKPSYEKFLQDTGIDKKFIFSIKVEGGGLSGQLDAIILGMARALEKFNKEKYRKVLREKGYLTVDARVRERRKVGTGGKARRKKQSPKR